MELDPAVFNGYNALGYAYLEKKEFGEAIAAFQKAIHHNPKAVEGYCDLGLTYLKKGDERKARKFFKKAQEIDRNALEGLRGVPEVDALLERGSS